MLIFAFIFLGNWAGWFCYTTPRGLCGVVKRSCEPFRQVPILADLIVDLRIDLPKIETYIEAQFAKSSGKEIDIISQAHHVRNLENGSNAEKNPILASQNEVYLALKRGHYDLIAAESFEIESLSFDAINQSIFAEVERRSGYPITEEDWEKFRIKEAELPYWGALKYVHEYPTCDSVGLERKAAIALHNEMGNVSEKLRNAPAYDRCYQFMSRLRSQIALARVLERLDKTKKRRAALVMGFRHREELECCRSHLGIQGITVDAVSKWMHLPEP